MQPLKDNNNSKKTDSRKRTHNERKGSLNKSLPDSTKRNNSLNTTVGRRITIDVRELEEIDNSFRLLFSMLEDLKRPVMMNNYTEDNQQNVEDIPKNNIDGVIHAVEEYEENDPYDPEEEFNRSDDNVLITNKYDSQYNTSSMVKNSLMAKTSGQPNATEDIEWVSNKSLCSIHFTSISSYLHHDTVSQAAVC